MPKMTTSHFRRGPQVAAIQKQQPQAQVDCHPRSKQHIKHQGRDNSQTGSATGPAAELQQTVALKSETNQNKRSRAAASKYNPNKSSSKDAKKYRPKNFQCPVCPLAFSNNGQLTNHVRIHTGERPFRCNVPNCGKTFTRNEELTRHKIIHTGVRPHPCPSCSKRFGRKDHLKKHVRTHENKKLGKHRSAPPEESVSIFKLDDSEPTKVRSQNARLSFSPKRGLATGEMPSTNLNLNAQPVNGFTSMQNQAASGMHFNQYNDDMNLLLPPPPPITFAPNTQFFDQTTANTMAAIATSTSLSMLSGTTSGPLQQLAGDYWQKWYNILGFYQQT